MNASYMVGNKKVSPPITCLRLTPRCDLSCKHCTYYLTRDKIDQEKVLMLAQKIAASDTMIVILTGGEPLLLPNLKEVIKVLKSKNKIVKLNTNGYQFDKLADLLISESVDSVTISFDGADADMHDFIRGKKGSFAKAIQSLKHIRQTRKGNKPFLAVRGVIMKENFRMVPEYIKLFDTLADEVHFQPIHNNIAHHEVIDRNMLFTEQDKHLEEEFIEMIESVLKSNPEFNTAYYQNFSNFLFHEKEMEVKALNSCLSIWLNFFTVLEDGECFTCTKNIGNLLNSDVESIWGGSDRINFLRSLAKFGKCKIPCWLNCTGVAPHILGVGIKSLLALGRVEMHAQKEFMQMPQYTGVQSSANQALE